jgi:hypothetical protein
MHPGLPGMHLLQKHLSHMQSDSVVHPQRPTTVELQQPVLKQKCVFHGFRRHRKAEQKESPAVSISLASGNSISSRLTNAWCC